MTKWKFLRSRDDNKENVNKFLNSSVDIIFLDTEHTAKHVEKIFYHYYSFLKKGGMCIIDDISWLPYSKDEYRDNEFTENINRSTFDKILEIYNQNKENFYLEFFFRESGYAIITKKKENTLNNSIKIQSRKYGLKNLLRRIYKRRPKN